MNKTTALIFAAVIVASTATSLSLAWGRTAEEVSIEIVSDTGATLLTIPYQEYRQEGTHISKQYLEAVKNRNYGIVIRNMTRDRVGVVIAVDGRNIISGKRSDLKNTENMYIVESYERGQYDGWRTDRNTVHKSYFTDLQDSYAMRTFRDSSSMGVIAVAVYREKVRPQTRYEMLKKNAPAAPAAESSAHGKARASRDEAAGTGFGDAQHSPTITVSFEPEQDPVQKILVKYEWREVLCRKGLLQCGQRQGSRLWDQDEYAPFPPL